MVKWHVIREVCEYIINNALLVVANDGGGGGGDEVAVMFTAVVVVVRLLEALTWLDMMHTWLMLISGP